MGRIIWLALLPLAACSGDATDGEPTGDTGETTDTSKKKKKKKKTGTPEGDLTGQFGWATVSQAYDSVERPGRRFAHAYFLSQEFQGLVNPAGCIFQNDICTDSYPKAGSVHRPNVLPISTFPSNVNRNVGDPWVANTILTSVSSPINGLPSLYQGTPTALSGPASLIIDGELAAYDSTGDFDIASPLVVTAPSTKQKVTLTPKADTVTFEWDKGGTGDMILEVGRLKEWQIYTGGLERDSIIFGLEDTGTFTASATDLGLDGNVDSVEVTLSRMTLTEVDAAGNAIQVQTRIDQGFRVDWLDPDPKFNELADKSYIANTCADAAGLAFVGDGGWYGDLSAYDNDSEVSANYTSSGRDGFIRVNMDAGEVLRVSMMQHDAMAMVYMYDAGCKLIATNDPDGRAPFGDVPLGNAGQPAALAYAVAGAGVYYLAIDGGTFGDELGGVFELDVSGTAGAD